MTESCKYRHLVVGYLSGDGLDVGCGQEVVVPNAIGFDLPDGLYSDYVGQPIMSAALLHGSADSLPFKDGTLDFVYSSHLLEDFSDWMPLLREWTRVLKIDGRLVIIIPDAILFGQAVNAGQPPNCNHKHEGTVGELTQSVRGLPLEVLEDRLTSLTVTDYSILFVAKKVS